ELWYSAPKKNAQERTESTLNVALKLLANWHKDTTIEKTNEFTFLGMTFDTKLTWKSYINKIEERVSNRLNVLKRLAGNVWGCARSTLNNTYKMFIQPIILYFCEPLITATEVTLKPLEKAHNQALRLITGGIKSTLIDAMFLVTGNTTICSLMKEKALFLYEKLLRIPVDKFFSTYENRPRHLKTQSGLIQKARELEKELQIDDKPKSLSLPMNPLADTDVVFCTQLLDFFRNSNTPPEQMRSLALETINVNYPVDQWLQVFIESQTNIGAGVFSELFSFYAASGLTSSAFEGEIEAIRKALCQLCCLDTKFTKAVILSDPQSPINSIGLSNSQSAINSIGSRFRTYSQQ
ncbi:unnamed protein product, partial [Rodentolepis nana]|uniref:Ras-GEF domain-containing protein n=1 Tax=Rodentolepis nana TaxID=102285 RepID=A0A0R3TSZ6_RODNA